MDKTLVVAPAVQVSGSWRAPSILGLFTQNAHLEGATVGYESL
jgi:hypothetical protein